MGLLVACSSIVPKKAKPSETTSVKDVRPQRFSVSIGGMMGTSYKVHLEGDHLVYEAFNYAFVHRKTELIYPSRDDWQAFWKEADKVAVWRWRSRYDESRIADGTQWAVQIDYLGHHIDSSGNNSWPGDRTPWITAAGYEVPCKRFDAFTQAVSKLIGGREFR